MELLVELRSINLYEIRLSPTTNGEYFRIVLSAQLINQQYIRK